MQKPGTVDSGMLPKTRPTTLSDGYIRRGLVSVLLSVAIVIMSGGSLLWLQWASQYGITLGYPIPSAHIMSPTTRVFTLHQNYQFAASANGRDTTYDWDFGDQSGDVGKSVTHAYQSNGTFVVTVTVHDPAGHYSSDKINVTVLPPPPQAAFTYSISGYGYVSFDASNSSADPSTSIVNYQWNFGDGTADTTSYTQESHYYYNTGTFQVTLVVVDATGQQSSTAATITIS